MTSARRSELTRVDTRARSKAVNWVRTNSPALWDRLLTEAYEELGVERRPVGRPRKPVPDSPESPDLHSTP